MARFMLRKDDPWLSSTEPDVRGWSVKDHDGRPLGQVEDVYMDDKTRQVASIVLASGRIIPSDHLSVYQDYLTVDMSISEGLPPLGRTEPIRPATADPAPGSFQARFTMHFESTYGMNSACTFEDLMPAYQFGRVQALGPRLFGDSFEQSEQDLRALYELHFPGNTYDAAREAIRFGFDLGASLRFTESLDALEEGKLSPDYKLDREQIRPTTSEPSTEQAIRTSAGMSVTDDKHTPT